MATEAVQDTTTSKPPPALRTREFRWFWIAQTISTLGSQIGHFAFSIVGAVVLGATPGQMGLILALGRIPPIVLGLPAGDLVDRIPRRRLLIALDFALAAIVASVPVLYALDMLTIYWLYANTLLVGAVVAIDGPAWNAFIPSLVRRDQLVDANSKAMLSWAATGFVGPGLAGMLVRLIKAPATMLVDVASFLISGVMMMTIKVEEVVDRAAAETVPIMRRISEGLRVAFLDRMQRAVTTPRAVLDFVDSMSGAVYVLYVLRVVGLGEVLLGVVFMVGAFGFTSASLVSDRIERRFGAGRSTLLGLAGVAISPFTMILANDANPTWLNIVYLGLPGIVGGFGGMVQHVMLISIRQTITPSRVLGRVWSSVSVLRGVLSVLGALTGGWLGERIGLRPTIVVVAFAYTIPFFYCLVSPLKTASTRETVEEPAPA